jgi:hypothetical protein
MKSYIKAILIYALLFASVYYLRANNDPTSHLGQYRERYCNGTIVITTLNDSSSL